MNFGIIFEKVADKDFPAGYFYAHIPSLGLTTQGLGLEGARQAAFDLARVWLAEKKAQGDPIPAPSENIRNRPPRNLRHFKQHFGMLGRDFQQDFGRPGGGSPALFPILERAGADA